jgi:hypothetical protein
MRQTIEWEAVDPDDDADAQDHPRVQVLQEVRIGRPSPLIRQIPASTFGIPQRSSRVDGTWMRVTAIDPEGCSTGQATSDEFTIVVLTRKIVAAPNPALDSVTFYYDLAADATLYVYDIADALSTAQSFRLLAHAHDVEPHIRRQAGCQRSLSLRRSKRQREIRSWKTGSQPLNLA